MASQSNSYQLVLFDGDEDRMKIFDDIKQLSKIPSHCKFYIFCNDPETIQRKILLHPANISGVCVRKSSIGDESILEFLNNAVDTYSFILIICGPNPSYRHVFPSIWKKYGHKKLFVMEMNNQSNITMKSILGQLRQHKNPSNASTSQTNDTQAFRDHPCPKCPQAFYTNDDLQKHDKNFHSLFSTKDLYMDSITNDASHKKSNQNEKFFAESQIRCSICNEDFQTNGDMKNHVKEKHEDYE